MFRITDISGRGVGLTSIAGRTGKFCPVLIGRCSVRSQHASGLATELFAHAWLKCGDIDMVGVEDAIELIPIPKFTLEIRRCAASS
jgi:hypothetical protein